MVDNPTKTILDVASYTVAAASLAEVLPNVAALFTVIWLGLRIYESKTVQDWLKQRGKR